MTIFLDILLQKLIFVVSKKQKNITTMKCKDTNNKRLLQQITKNYFLGKFEDNIMLFKIIDKTNAEGNLSDKEKKN